MLPKSLIFRQVGRITSGANMPKSKKHIAKYFEMLFGVGFIVQIFISFQNMVNVAALKANTIILLFIILLIYYYQEVCE